MDKYKGLTKGFNTKESEDKDEWFRSKLGSSQEKDLGNLLSRLMASSNQGIEQYVQSMLELENFYLVESIISSIIDDSLSPEVSSGEIVRITSKNVRANSLLKELQDNLDLDNIVLSFIRDMLVFRGEYFLRLVTTPGKGIVDIVDDVIPGSVLAFYQNGFPAKFAKMTTRKGVSTRIETFDPASYAHFYYGTRKLRNAEDLIRNNSELYSLVSKVRCGRPIFYGVLDKLRELVVLEKLIPGTKISNLVSGSLVSIEVPPATSPKDAFEISRKYEELFNQKVSFDQKTGEMSAAQILATAGRVKVIPTFGSKGNLSAVDAKNTSDVSDIQQSINDIREVICSSLAFPTGLLYGGASRGDLIKQNARYIKRIKAIQTSIASGLMQIAITHLINHDDCPAITPADITISFRSSAINIDELERLEFMDATIGYISNAAQLITTLNDAGMSIVDKNKFASWVGSKLEFVSYDIPVEDSEAIGKTTPPPPETEQ